MSMQKYSLFIKSLKKVAIVSLLLSSTTAIAQPLTCPLPRTFFHDPHYGSFANVKSWTWATPRNLDYFKQNYSVVIDPNNSQFLDSYSLKVTVYQKKDTDGRAWDFVMCDYNNGMAGVEFGNNENDLIVSGQGYDTLEKTWAHSSLVLPVNGAVSSYTCVTTAGEPEKCSVDVR